MSHHADGGVMRRLVTGTVVLALPLLALVPAAQASAPVAPSFTRIQGAAGDAAGLQPTVDAYRALLGDPTRGSTGTVCRTTSQRPI